MTVIAVGGPPHSGKSVFVAELYRQLLKHSNRVFLQQVCPDGEGMWSSEADQRIVASLRKKGVFSAEFIGNTLNAIEQLGRNPRFSIVLLDLGGKLTPENAKILQCSDFLIVLSSNLQDINEWQQFARSEDCETIAALQSRLQTINGGFDQAVRSHISFTPSLATGVLWNLDRNSGVAPYQSAVAQLATWLHDRFVLG